MLATDRENLGRRHQPRARQAIKTPLAEGLRRVAVVLDRQYGEVSARRRDVRPNPRSTVPKGDREIMLRERHPLRRCVTIRPELAIGRRPKARPHTQFDPICHTNDRCKVVPMASGHTGEFLLAMRGTCRNPHERSSRPRTHFGGLSFVNMSRGVDVPALARPSHDIALIGKPT